MGGGGRAGTLDAQSNLGCTYQHGDSVEVDYAKAVDMYKKSAEQGHVVAQNNLGKNR